MKCCYGKLDRKKEVSLRNVSPKRVRTLTSQKTRRSFGRNHRTKMRRHEDVGYVSSKSLPNIRFLVRGSRPHYRISRFSNSHRIQIIRYQKLITGEFFK